MQDRTHNGIMFRILNVIDEHSRECLLVVAARSFTHRDVMKHLTDLFCEMGVPVYIRSDNGPEFIARWAPKMVETTDGQTAFHRARQSLGERLY